MDEWTNDCLYVLNDGWIMSYMDKELYGHIDIDYKDD